MGWNPSVEAWVRLLMSPDSDIGDLIQDIEQLKRALFAPSGKVLQRIEEVDGPQNVGIMRVKSAR